MAHTGACYLGMYLRIRDGKCRGVAKSSKGGQDSRVGMTENANLSLMLIDLSDADFPF